MNVAQNHGRLFQPRFYLLIHPKQRLSTNGSLVTAVVTISCICSWKRQVGHFTCWKDARCRGQRHSICQRALASEGRERDTKTWFFGLSGVGVLAPVTQRSLLHIKVSLSKMSNPIRAREAGARMIIPKLWLVTLPSACERLTAILRKWREKGFITTINLNIWPRIGWK